MTWTRHESLLQNAWTPIKSQHPRTQINLSSSDVGIVTILPSANTNYAKIKKHYLKIKINYSKIKGYYSKI